MSYDPTKMTVLELRELHSIIGNLIDASVHIEGAIFNLTAPALVSVPLFHAAASLAETPKSEHCAAAVNAPDAASISANEAPSKLEPTNNATVEPQRKDAGAMPKTEPRAKISAPANGAEWSDQDDARIIAAVMETPEYAINVIARRVAPELGRTADAVAHRISNNLRKQVDRIKNSVDVKPVQRPSRITMMNAQAAAMQKASGA